MYQYGKTFFPLHINNRNGTLLQSEYKLYILVEADLESYNPVAATHATKVYPFMLIMFFNFEYNYFNKVHISSFIISRRD